MGRNGLRCLPSLLEVILDKKCISLFQYSGIHKCGSLLFPLDFGKIPVMVWAFLSATGNPFY